MDYYNLGTYGREVTTVSAAAQLWFDRGLVWLYGYNHEEAIVCFEKAIAHDPACAMAHWGVAYAIGPNYNKPWDDFDEDEKPEALGQALVAVAAAMANIDAVTPTERALIEALRTRYPDSADVDSFDPWHDAYADAMRAVYKAHDGDLDVASSSRTEPVNDFETPTVSIY